MSLKSIMCQHIRTFDIFILFQVFEAITCERMGVKSEMITRCNCSADSCGFKEKCDDDDDNIMCSTFQYT